jgi:hypothetical protein
MKIETIAPSQKNIIVKFSNNIRVSFQNGVGEVSKEDGEFLLGKYPEQLFPEGKVVLPKATIPASKPSVDGSIVESLRNQLQRANSLVNDYKAQLGSAKENERVWRTKCQDLMLENHSLKDLLGQPVKAEEKKAEIEDIRPIEADTEIVAKTEAEMIREKLSGKTVKELTAIVEDMKLPVDEYKMLNKNKLVDYIIEKTNASA